MPKAETGVDRFLADYPDYDGRGVIVAIFDTGVDPGALGLQTTPQGEPKIVDLVDASGSGDVDTTTVATLNDEGTLTGLTGRTLHPDPAWTNPTGEYRLGMKAGYEIFPGGLVGRLRREHRRDLADEQANALAEARALLVEFDAAHDGKLDDDVQMERDDLQARFDQLEAMWGSYDDPGPLFDCLVFHDGEVWRAAVDTDEDGDFADEKAMTNFRRERQYATFGEEDLLNFALNIYEDGDILSIVADAGSHGTHVAGIVAAYRPDEPEMNGMAPGAQIVSVKIGDTRLGSESVGTGEIRGLRAVLDNDCDLINMSYGGPSAFADEGRVGDLLSEIVNDHGVIFVASAGNDGPCISTIGNPGGTTDALISVAAAISPEMMRAQYSVREPHHDVNYTWTSNGPCVDGALGVDISAPGGAISPVPNWNLQQNMLMNGTSMAAPNACGGLALLVSGMKAEERDYSPHSIRRAMINTAEPVEGVDVFAQGPGMLQVDRAWEHLVRHDDSIDENVRYRVSVEEREGGRGIYLREPFENNEPALVRVNVDAIFPKKADNRDKVNFEMQLELEATEDWVTVSDTLRMMHGGRRFRVEIDPTDLDPGAHYAEVLAFDARQPEMGPVFRVPVSVIRTERVNERDWSFQRRLPTEAGRIERLFIEVPRGATWADIHLTRRDVDTNRLLVLQTLQLLDDRAYDDHYGTHYITFDDNQEALRTIPVEGGGTLEVAAAQYWSSLGEGDFEIDVRFHGVTPTSAPLVLNGATTIEPLDLRADLGRQHIDPRGTLTHVRRTIRPVETTIEPLRDQRDLLPDGRGTYRLICDYDFSLDERTSLAVKPAIGELPQAWEDYESMLWIVFDSNKRVVDAQCGNDDVITLDAGEYRLRYHVRHDNPKELEKIKDLALALEIRLPGSIGVDFYGHPGAAHAHGGASAAGVLESGQRRRVYAAVPQADALPGLVQEGDVLIGTYTIGAREEAQFGPGRRPGGYPLVYLPAAEPVAKDKPRESAEEAVEEEPTSEEIARDERLEALQEEIDADADAETIAADFATLKADFPGHLPLLKMQLKWRQDAAELDNDAVLDSADDIVSAIDQTALAAHFGVNNHQDDAEHEQRQAEREALIEALKVRVELLGERCDGAAEGEAFAAYVDAIEELKRWTDWDSEGCFDLRLADAFLRGHQNTALSLLAGKISDNKLDREAYEKRLDLLRDMGLDTWVDYEERWLLRRFREAYPLF